MARLLLALAAVAAAQDTGRPNHVDCQVESWGAWWPCDATCGIGSQVRQRKVLVQQENRGIPCPDLIMHQSCNAGPCPIHCEVGSWDEWSQCSTPCGLGSKYRSRKIITRPTTDGTVCPSLEEEAQCIEKGCPVDCVVGEWSAYGECDVTCGSGTQTRTRKAITGALYGGTTCPRLVDGTECNRGPCPVHCKVSRWSHFSSCSKSCGDGTKSRTRSIKVKASKDGTVCPALEETIPCRARDCPINCEVGKWSKWSTCTKTCGKGLTSRSRKIVTQAAFGGKDCPSINSRRFCNTQACPVDCEVTPFTAWTECSMSCGTGGFKKRERTIIKKSAAGGIVCPSLKEQISCTFGPCPVHCVVGPFFAWGACNKSCGGGVMQRSRMIIKARGHGGHTCPNLIESQSCNTESCPVDCKVGKWDEWKPELGAGGNYVRRRPIVTPVGFGGVACPTVVERKHHKGVTCTEHDVFGAWSKCTKKCDTGFQYRYKEHLKCAEKAVVKYHAKMRQAKHCNLQKCKNPDDAEEMYRVRVPAISDGDKTTMKRLLSNTLVGTVLVRTSTPKK